MRSGFRASIGCNDRLRDGVASVVEELQFAFFDQRMKPVGQFAARFASCAEIVQELFMARRFFRLPIDVAKYGGVGKAHFVIL